MSREFPTPQSPESNNRVGIIKKETELREVEISPNVVVPSKMTFKACQVGAQRPVGYTHMGSICKIGKIQSSSGRHSNVVQNNGSTRGL